MVLHPNAFEKDSVRRKAITMIARHETFHESCDWVLNYHKIRSFQKNEAKKKILGTKKKPVAI